MSNQVAGPTGDRFGQPQHQAWAAIHISLRAQPTWGKDFDEHVPSAQYKTNGVKATPLLWLANHILPADPEAIGDGGSRNVPAPFTSSP